MRPRAARSRERGSAAVETLLSVPFLVLFLLAMVDFCRGLRAGQESLRASRHVAWASERAKAWPGTPAPPDEDEVRTTHFRGRGELEVRTRERAIETRVPVVSDVAGAVRGIGSWAFSLLGMGGVNEGLGFLEGRQRGTHVDALRPISYFHVLPVPTRADAHHFVIIRSGVDPNPRKPQGWGDPFSRFRGSLP
jgi:hypothetical protein